MSFPPNDEQKISKNFGEQTIQAVWSFDPSMQIISWQGPKVVSIESAYNEGSR